MYVPLLQQEDCKLELREWRAGSLSRDIVFIYGYSPYRLFVQILRIWAGLNRSEEGSSQTLGYACAKPSRCPVTCAPCSCSSVRHSVGEPYHLSVMCVTPLL